MSSQTTLRFSVTDGDKRASIWSIVVPKKKPEVYIFNKFLGSINVSFHGSGKWHTKFADLEEKQRVSFNQDVTDAYIEKWRRPDESKPNVTVAFRIITPWGSVRPQKSTSNKSFVPVTNAEPGHNTEIIILFIKPGIELEVKNAQLIGSITLCNGETVVVVRTQIPLSTRAPSSPIKIPDFTNRISFIDLFRGNLGTIVHGTASDGSRVMWDIVIRVTLLGYAKLSWRKMKRGLGGSS